MSYPKHTSVTINTNIHTRPKRHKSKESRDVNGALVIQDIWIELLIIKLLVYD